MQNSKFRHPLAILRTICGLGQKELGDLVDRAAITIQKVENGPANNGLRLTEQLAERLSHETGISIEWLLAGDVNARPIGVNREEFTRETFVRWRAGKTHADRSRDWQLSGDAVQFYGQVRAILDAANNRSRYAIAAYRINEALATIAQQLEMKLPAAATTTESTAAIVADIQMIDAVNAATLGAADGKPQFPKWGGLYSAEIARRRAETAATMEKLMAKMDTKPRGKSKRPASKRPAPKAKKSAN